MNAGLSSLTVLKTHVMPVAMRARTDFDDQLVALGTGVAMLMERYCGRQFTRQTSATFKAPADNLVFSLPRYPLESLTSAILTDPDGNTTTLTADVQRTDLDAGLVYFASVPGTNDDYITFTFAGGFWWDTTEDSSDTLPSGANALPADLFLAFVMQMKAVVEAQALFGIAAANADGKSKQPVALELIPSVKDILNTYRRF